MTFGLRDETYIITTLHKIPDQPWGAMQAEQDNVLLHEYWYLFVQQRVEVEHQLTDVPEGHVVVFHTCPEKTDPVDFHRITVAYHGKISQFYQLCKSTTEWKELWADWLFHRGKLPSIALCNNTRYEAIYSSVNVEIKDFVPACNNSTFLGLKTIMTSAVFQTLTALKGAIRAITTLEHDTSDPHCAAVLALKHKGVVQAREILRLVDWPGQSVALDLTRKEVNLAATQRELEKQILQWQNVQRVASYRLGELLGVVIACTFFNDVSLSAAAHEQLACASEDLADDSSTCMSSGGGDSPDDDQHTNTGANLHLQIEQLQDYIAQFDAPRDQHIDSSDITHLQDDLHTANSQTPHAPHLVCSNIEQLRLNLNAALAMLQEHSVQIHNAVGIVNPDGSEIPTSEHHHILDFEERHDSTGISGEQLIICARNVNNLRQQLDEALAAHEFEQQSIAEHGNHAEDRMHIAAQELATAQELADARQHAATQQLAAVQHLADAQRGASAHQAAAAQHLADARRDAAAVQAAAAQLLVDARRAAAAQHAIAAQHLADAQALAHAQQAVAAQHLAEAQQLADARQAAAAEQAAAVQLLANAQRDADAQEAAAAQLVVDAQRDADAQEAAAAQELADAEQAAAAQELADAEQAAAAQELADAEQAAPAQHPDAPNAVAFLNELRQTPLNNIFLDVIHPNSGQHPVPVRTMPVGRAHAAFGMGLAEAQVQLRELIAQRNTHMRNVAANAHGMALQLNAATDPMLSLVRRASTSLAAFSRHQISNTTAEIIPAMLRLTAASNARIQAANLQAQREPPPRAPSVVSLVLPMPIPTQRPSLTASSRASRASGSDLFVVPSPAASAGARSDSQEQETDAEKITKVIQMFTLFHTNLTTESLKQWVIESGCYDRNSCIRDFKEVVLAAFVDVWHMHSTDIKNTVLDRIVPVFAQERTINRMAADTNARREERIVRKLKEVVEAHLNIRCELNRLTRVVDEQNGLVVPGCRPGPVYTLHGGYETLHEILVHT